MVGDPWIHHLITGKAWGGGQSGVDLTVLMEQFLDGPEVDVDVAWRSRERHLRSKTTGLLEISNFLVPAVSAIFIDEFSNFQFS